MHREHSQLQTSYLAAENLSQAQVNGKKEMFDDVESVSFWSTSFV